LLKGIGVASSRAANNKITKPTIRLGAATALGHRGWIATSTTFRMGMTRFKHVFNLSVDNGRAAIHRGNVGVGWPAII
jgi:hypothetical protein